MTPSVTLSIDSPDATLANAGGKGVNLVKMARAGLPVPPGFIVATDAYRQFVAANDLQPFIVIALADTNSDDPVALETASAAIRGRFAAAPLPPDLSTAILDAYRALTTDDRSPVTDHLPVAVRSSATAEDLPDMSFAGQQDTFLNVVGDAALLKAVRDCWSSLWTARAIAYRARNGIDQASVALAVVVQAMVESEASGVLFTANPLTGRRGETVIDATLGLGEALVSGQVEPDQYVVDSVAGRIVERRLGAKALAIRGQAGGGTVTVENDAAGVQALPDGAILELARLGKRVERDLYDGAPQDIEWAWAGGRLYLLQARAITSLYPLPAGLAARPLHVLFSVNHMQGMLDPFTPLGQDFLIEAFLAIGRLAGKDFTAASQRDVLIAGGRIYADITPGLRHDLARRLVVRIPGVIEPGSEQALFSVLDDPDLQPDRSGLSPAALRTLARLASIVGRRAVLAMRDPVSQRDAVVRELDLFIANATRRAAATTTLAQRLALWQTLYDEFAFGLALKLLPLLVAGMMSFYQLRRLARRELGSDLLTLEIARGLPHNVTTEMDLTLWTVAQVIRDDPASAARFGAEDAAALAEDFRAGRLPLPAQVALTAFMDRYGMRGLAEIDLGRPRWREDPAHVIGVLQSYLGIDDPQQAPDVVFRRGARVAEAAIEELVQAMPSAAEAGLARLFASRMRALAGMRETPKFTIVRMMGVVRAMLLRSGEDLVVAGVLARPTTSSSFIWRSWRRWPRPGLMGSKFQPARSETGQSEKLETCQCVRLERTG
ncbi:MAG: phosphoenolpyruvate synthase [Anaerolineales bacterium]|nr:phosphoenolpyruvate synthase [Anaerolineales bacterium]